MINECCICHWKVGMPLDQPMAGQGSGQLKIWLFTAFFSLPFFLFPQKKKKFLGSLVKEEIFLVPVAAANSQRVRSQPRSCLREIQVMTQNCWELAFHSPSPGRQLPDGN